MISLGIHTSARIRQKPKITGRIILLKQSLQANNLCRKAEYGINRSLSDKIYSIFNTGGQIKMINLEKEIREQPAVLKSVRSANHDVMSELITELRRVQPKNIYFAARGTSDHACIFAQYLFGIYMGIPCGLATPSVISQYGAKINYKGDLVVGVSQSGAAEDVLSVIREAKESGAVTVAITNNTSSALAKEADFHLYCNAGPETSIAATKTFTSQMYLLALLCALWSDNSELLDQLEKLPSAVAELLDTMPAQIDTMVSRWRYLDDAIILGRGTAYPIALEGALKILETNKIRVKGYPVSDFWHGPLAQVSAKTLMIVLAAEGKMMKDTTAMINRLDEIGADVVVITDNKELADSRRFALRIPRLSNDSISPFLLAVTMQLTALKLTEVKGIDPDSSAVLKKVTVTK